MRKLRITLAALALVVTGSISSFAQTADEIIQKHVAAIGGADAWKKVNSVRREGTMNLQGMEIPLVEVTQHNKGVKLEINLAGQVAYQIVTPIEGWAYFPMTGQTSPEPMGAEEIKDEQYRLNTYGDFVDHKTNGTKVELAGKEKIDGKDVYKFKVTSKDGVVKTAYIDAKDFFLVRQVRKVKTNGQETEVTMDFSDFQKQGGLVFPMTILTSDGEMKFSKVEVNTTVDEGMFKPTN